MSYKRALKKVLDPKSEDRTPFHKFAPHVLEGTAFAGANRAVMRAHGARSKDRPNPIHLPEHWLRKRLRERAEEARVSKAKPPKRNVEPKSYDWRVEQYGVTPTPRQQRRALQKYKRAARLALTATE